MAQEASSPAPMEINVEVEDVIFAMERILILLIPFSRSTTALGFLLTSIMAAAKSINSPSSKSSSRVFDCLFWVERVACILLWWSFVEGIYGRCWYGAVFLFNFSNMVFLIRRRFQPINNNKEIKLNKMVTEDSLDELHKISKLVREEAWDETNEEQDYLGANSKDQNDNGIESEVGSAEFEFKAINKSAVVAAAMVNENSAETDINISLKLELEPAAEKNGKKELRISKVEVKDAQILDALYQEKLKQINDRWEERLNEERQLREHIIHHHIHYISKFLSDTEWLMQQVEIILCTWEKEKQELQRRIDSTTALYENLEERNKEEDWAREEERNYFVNKIRACEKEIERLEEERVILFRRVKEVTRETSDSKWLIEKLKVMEKEVSESLKKIIEVEAEKKEMAQKLEEQETMAEECKTQLQECVKKCQELEEENRYLSESFETMATSNDFDQIMEVLRMRCGELEEENARLHTANEMSEFYKNIMRNSGI